MFTMIFGLIILHQSSPLATILAAGVAMVCPKGIAALRIACLPEPFGQD